MSTLLLPGDTPTLRKQRGAFFTPSAIADFLAAWATAGRADARVLDPTCGEAVFLLAAARRLAANGAAPSATRELLHGVDLHGESLEHSRELLNAEGFDADLVTGDFFAQPTPAQLGGGLPWMDAVIGNPPFVRYQQHRGDARKLSAAAALAQGVRLSGLASSWAALLVHACSFLKPDGRVAMVLPAELLTVGYAEPVRRWLRGRFERVHLVLFDELQFADAAEQVVLLVASGSGGCERDGFVLHEVRDAAELERLHIFDSTSVRPEAEGKWTNLLLRPGPRTLFPRVVEASFAKLAGYGSPELGTVTGGNDFFALTEATRARFALKPGHLTPIVPPGTRHLRGTRFTQTSWEELRLRGERVWLLNPTARRATGGLARYLAHGEELGVPGAYKCTVRTPWWKPPVVKPPDLFFTYMSHRYPRLIANEAGVLVPELDARPSAATGRSRDRARRPALAGVELRVDARRGGVRAVVWRRHPQDGAARGRAAPGPVSRRPLQGVEARRRAPRPARRAAARGPVARRRRSDRRGPARRSRRHPAC